MSLDERRIRQRLKDDLIHFCESCLKLSSKKLGIVPFVLNEAQIFLHEQAELQLKETGKVRILLLKARQMGMSSYIGGRFYQKTIHRSGVHTFILTHLRDATQNLYNMVRTFFDETPAIVKPKASTDNAKELVFAELKSGYKLGTAGTKQSGRSSTIHLLHGSEVAFWKNSAHLAAGLLQAVPNEPGTEIFLESTAKGVGTYFHQLWQRAINGDSDFKAVFLPWFWMKDYRVTAPENFIRTDEEQELVNIYNITDDQLYWRRYKIIELTTPDKEGLVAFKEEYPCCAAEAFQMSGSDTYISTELYAKARICKAEAIGPLIIGVDVAREGNDRTCILIRQGRVIHEYKFYYKKLTNEVTALVHTAILKWSPQLVCVDMVGVGAGVFDSLVLLHGSNMIKGVQAGETALECDKYSNKRAEMWANYKLWFLDAPCQVPDDDALHADTCGIKSSFDSNGRLVMEKKSDMKKRGVMSPDAGDAACLTFAYNIGLLSESAQAQILKDIVQHNKTILNTRQAAWNQK